MNSALFATQLLCKTPEAARVDETEDKSKRIVHVTKRDVAQAALWATSTPIGGY